MIRWAVFTASVLLMADSSAEAQFTPSRPLIGGSSFAPSTPTVSPYINILRGGGSPAINYYGIVRPSQDFRSTIQTLQQEYQSVTGSLEGGAMTPTTHQNTRFLNTGNYFMNINRGGSSTSSSGSGVTSLSLGSQPRSGLTGGGGGTQPASGGGRRP